MSKRPFSTKIEKYKNKIRKLEEKQNKYRRLIVYSDESDNEVERQCPVYHDHDNEVDLSHEPIYESVDQQPGESQSESQHAAEQEPSIFDLQNPKVLSDIAGSQNLPSTSTSQPTVDESSLDPELLLALGEYTSDTPEYGEKVHESLAKLWLPILKKGLPKEDREKVLKQYLVPDNCRFMQAPKLNAEISAAVSEVVRGRDKKCLGIQQQLGQGIAAINRGMNVLLTGDKKIDALKALSDSCRILSDLHYFLTKDRIKLIVPSLDKSFLHVLQDAERDNTLFGNELSDKIKACKAIERQGSQIRKHLINQNNQKQSSRNTATTAPPQGNWSAPRYPANRGGRGSFRKPYLQTSTTRRPYSGAVPTKTPHQSKPRAAAPQQ